MNIILASAQEFCGNRLTLLDRRAEHIVKVLRAQVGDTLRVGEIDGRRGTATILSLKRRYPFRVELAVDMQNVREPLPVFDLILALPRPIILRRILSQMAAMGVGTIHLINAKRVEKSFWQASILKPEEYQQHFLQGLEQAVATRLPRLKIHPRFRPFVEDYLPTLAGDHSHRLLAHPIPQSSGGGSLVGSEGRILVAIGPEGGWIDYELEKFSAQGFVAFTLGERILKVDTAVVAAHSRLLGMREWAAGKAMGQPL